MALPIGSIGSIPSIAPASSGATPATTPAAGFGEALTRMLQSASDSEDHANAAVGSMLDGSGEVHDDDRLAARRALAATDRPGAQQARLRLPGHHADAGSAGAGHGLFLSCDLT